ncbi:hypothetical protein ERX46_02700 [Brumimicrobium glaciale]|uniref:GP-PDE domain-containing protein n=1 Tax=Brumimicrobium glaciale TaxID=200475 RepID=A0A4Q4KQX2_9FLAO|nr:glycerophosphodiester phosphodiesterase family protein [Brumimicrobium glaciale]RYM35920.1 hypothetical protein ERX46_02700 [Brumimicrobium glaciale]
MKSLFSIFFLVFSLFLISSCSKQPDVFLELNIPQDISFIGHKGSGTINENGNIELIENSWEAIANAINSIDGSEMDLQLSADSTLWIFHDDSLYNCNGSLINFSLFNDDELSKISECHYNSTLIKLSDFLRKAQQEEWKEKLICFDMKVFYNLETIHLFKDYTDFSIFVRDKLNRLIQESKIETKIIFEVFNTQQFKVFDSVFKGQTYLVDPFPTEESISANNNEQINLSLPIHNLPKNLNPNEVKIQDLWTINSANEFFEALVLSPEIMQSDNIPMMQFFEAIQSGQKALRLSHKNESVKTNDKEFHSLLTLNLPLEKDQLIEFKTLKGDYQKEVLLVFKAVDENGNSVHWQGIDLSEKPNSYFFINPEFLAFKNAKTVHINIWNKSRSKLNNEYSFSQFELE